MLNIGKVFTRAVKRSSTFNGVNVCPAAPALHPVTPQTLKPTPNSKMWREAYALNKFRCNSKSRRPWSMFDYLISGAIRHRLESTRTQVANQVI